MNMQDPDYVKGLKANMHAVFDSPQGKEIMKFMEVTCCWYRSVYAPDAPDMTLINDGKRQVIATIKTILECTPDQIMALTKQKEE